MLALVVGPVADAHGLGVVIAGEVTEHLLLELALAAHPVHDLKLTFLRLHDIGDEVEEVVRLLVEAERVERPEHERRVADPAIAVVPVAITAGSLRQRGGGRRDQRSRRRVAQSLERQRTALQIGAPGVVGEVPVL